jgi:hypothetical protein
VPAASRAPSTPKPAAAPAASPRPAAVAPAAKPAAGAGTVDKKKPRVSKEREAIIDL